jgi:hypothetical protein
VLGRELLGRLGTNMNSGGLESTAPETSARWRLARSSATSAPKPSPTTTAGVASSARSSAAASSACSSTVVPW